MLLLTLSLRPDRYKIKNREQDNEKTQLEKFTARGLCALSLRIGT